MLRGGDTGTMPAPVAEDFFKALDIKQTIEGADLVLARRLLEDERLPVSQFAASAIRNAKDAPQDYFDAIAAAMFKRLRGQAASAAVNPDSAWNEELSAIGRVLAALPRETVLKHRQDLEWLARQGALRVPTYLALSRFADFGPDGVDMLLWLIDDAQKFRYDKGRAWEHPFLAGLIGLCTMGAEGRKAIQPLFDRLDSGVIANRGGYNQLAIHALVRMGADPEEIWLHWRKKGKDAVEDSGRERHNFDREVGRAMESTVRGKSACH